MPENTPSTPETSRFDMPGMTLLEHLEELRRRIINSVLAVIVCAGFCWYYAEYIYEYVQEPIVKVLHDAKLPEKLVFLHPTEPFEMYMHIGMVAGIFLASPFILWQVWQFISPGLYRHEKNYIAPFLVSTVGLFVAGGVFAYKMVFPNSLHFLIVDSGKQFQPQITISEYTNLFMAVILGLGIVFELPILVFFLALFGIIDAKMMWKYSRFSILIIFFIAAIITPTTDILNMCIFAAPMCILYFISIGIAWLVHPKRRNRDKNEATS